MNTSIYFSLSKRFSKPHNDFDCFYPHYYPGTSNKANYPLYGAL